MQKNQIAIWIFISALLACSFVSAQTGNGEQIQPALISSNSVHILTAGEIVRACSNDSYRPKIKSAEGFMDLLQCMYKYSIAEVMNERVNRAIVNDSELLAAMNTLKLGTRLNLKEINSLSLARVQDSMRLDIFFNKAVSSVANYYILNMKMDFPEETSWSIESSGNSFVLKNIQGMPKLTGNILGVLINFKITDISEVGTFHYTAGWGESIFGYFIGKTRSEDPYFGGLEVQHLSLRWSDIIKAHSSLRYKGIAKAWPEEIPSTSRLKDLVKV